MLPPQAFTNPQPIFFDDAMLASLGLSPLFDSFAPLIAFADNDADDINDEDGDDEEEDDPDEEEDDLDEVGEAAEKDEVEDDEDAVDEDDAEDEDTEIAPESF